MVYSARPQRSGRRLNKSNQSKVLIVSGILVLLVLVGVGLFVFLKPDKKQAVPNHLKFDSSVTETEKSQITTAINDQNIKLDDDVTISAKSVLEAPDQKYILSAYVPITGLYSSRQSIGTSDITGGAISFSNDIEPTVLQSVTTTLSTQPTQKSSEIEPESTDIVLIPASRISPSQKLLGFDGSYYLDDLSRGGVFRVIEISGAGKSALDNINVNILPNKDQLFKVNMTGVTALTRLMMRKLNSIRDPAYFSQKIGPFLADADLTHVSNEVSFQAGCQYHNTVFCSPPEFIKTLQDSGVDLVELTGNHNNDTGSQYNTETINSYHQLDIKTFGGGLNAEEAKKPYIADQKGSKITFLGYNYADSPSGISIATAERAGANSFDFDKVKTDIESAKQQSQFVIVDIQFNECFAYPDGYVEFPECNSPINGQQDVFRKVADLGADMVIGTQAHQPQIYEMYNNKPIYYGLGNMYFEQTQWPGTERGIILTHYFHNGKLIQTKLTPTVYDQDLQTKQMTNEQSVKFFDYLNSSR